MSTIRLNPGDPGDFRYKIKRIVRESGMTLSDITVALRRNYGVEISDSALSHNIARASAIRLGRALQILKICGVQSIEIES